MHAPLRSLALAALCAASPALAESWDYTFSVPDGREGTFDLPFPVQYAGTVTIDVSWSGGRLLFFGLEGPGHVSRAHRSGPSPQRLELPVDPATIATGTQWKLTIKALPARGEASGRLRVTAPDSPEVVAKREAILHPPPPPPPPPPAWALRRDAPQGASLEIAHVYEAVEDFRAAILAKTDGPPDACSWQIDFLKYAEGVRDRLGATGAPPDVPTQRYLNRLSEAIHSVDHLRTSKDPIIAGPVPEDRDPRYDWLLARNEIIRPLERSLDSLTDLLRGGHAPKLEDEVWLPRLNACLTACERFFDERVRLGGEENAPNRELTFAQWERIRSAGRVLDSLRPFFKESAPPDS